MTRSKPRWSLRSKKSLLQNRMPRSKARHRSASHEKGTNLRRCPREDINMDSKHAQDPFSRQQAILIRHRKVFEVHAFGERCSLPLCKACTYLTWLLPHPGEPITPGRLMRKDDYRHAADATHQESVGDLKTDGKSFDPAMLPAELRKVRERIQILEHMIPARLEELGRDGAVNALGDRRDRKEDLELFVAELERLQKVWALSATRNGNVRDLNSKYDSDRTTTRRNLKRLYKELRDGRMRQTAEHLEQSIVYRGGRWVYKATILEWTVEYDM